MFKKLAVFLLALLVVPALVRAAALRFGWLRSECVAQTELRQVLPDVRLDAKDIEEAVNSLRGKTVTKIVFTKAARYDLQAPHRIELRLKDVTLAQVMNRLIAVRPDNGLTYVAQGESIVIAMPEDLPQSVSTRAYDIRDLLPLDETPRPPPATPVSYGLFGNPSAALILRSPRQETADDLVERIQSSVAVDAWSSTPGGSTSIVPGTITTFGGWLIVTQTPAVHWQVKQFLEALRADWHSAGENHGGS